MKNGRPKKVETIVEELNMEITAAALEGMELDPPMALKRLLAKIAVAASHAQSVNRGLRSPNGEINAALIEFLDCEESLN